MHQTRQRCTRKRVAPGTYATENKARRTEKKGGPHGRDPADPPPNRGGAVLQPSAAMCTLSATASNSRKSAGLPIRCFLLALLGLIATNAQSPSTPPPSEPSSPPGVATAGDDPTFIGSDGDAYHVSIRPSVNIRELINIRQPTTTTFMPNHDHSLRRCSATRGSTLT